MKNKRAKSQSDPDKNRDLSEEIAALRAEVAMLNSHRFVRIQNKLWRLFLLRFGMGIFTGLGTVVGATVVVSLLAVWLKQIEWIPLIGDWASEIAQQIDIDDSSSGGAVDSPEAQTPSDATNE